MRKTLIITSHVDGLDQILINPSAYSSIICADGGLLVTEELGIQPDFFIGDYDSAPQPQNDSVIKLPTEKDMTDSEAAIDFAVSKGSTHIEVLGGLGGRFDHTMGNIGMLAKYCGILKHLAFMDGQNYIFMIMPGTIFIPKNTYPYLGVISYGESAEDVTLRGVKYPLTGHSLTNNTTLGVSNEIVRESASVSFTGGRLLIVLSKDLDK